MGTYPRTIFLIALIMPLSCKTSTTATNSKIQEAWDNANAPSQFGVQSLTYQALAAPDSLGGHLPVKPWTDSYWPLDKKSIAMRYLEKSSDFKSFDDQVKRGYAPPDSTTLSPAEKYDILMDDPNYSLTQESWATYGSYARQMGDTDWSWMGICHGWAPAAYREPAPKQPVLAQAKSGRKVLLFEGDIKGLMSKAYATNDSNKTEKLIGSRCQYEDDDGSTDNSSSDHDPIIKDKQGRPVDGAFDDTKQPFFIVKNQWKEWGTLEVIDHPGDKKTYWLATPKKNLPNDALSGTYKVYVYDSYKNLNWDYYVRGLGTNAVGTRPVTFYRSCRDLNAASFHLVLTRYLSRTAANTPTGQRGFVIERTRTAEVWNQPMFGFASTIGPLIPVEQDAPGSRVFRAPGTTHIAKVKTTAAYIDEDGPKATYKDSENFMPNFDDHTILPSDEKSKSDLDFNYMNLEYTLEFDINGWLIGGEWDETSPHIADAPDFLWTSEGQLKDKSSDGRPSVIKYSVAKALLNCSINGTATEKSNVTYYDSDADKNVTKEILAVPCQI